MIDPNNPFQLDFVDSPTFHDRGDAARLKVAASASAPKTGVGKPLATPIPSRKPSSSPSLTSQPSFPIGMGMGMGMGMPGMGFPGMGMGMGMPGMGMGLFR
jgi:hypothetical protein